MSDAFGSLYRGRTVLITGHTGFKGSWLALWLRQLGANVVGISLDPPTGPSHFEACGLADELVDMRHDVRDYEGLVAILDRHRPELVFHLAAQPLVRRAFLDPRETFDVNVMGTVNLLEAARRCVSVRSVVVATSDKCYRNVGWEWAYRETDPLGGHEPYAGSKACAELVVEVYRQQRFQAHAVQPRISSIASARAGNVIGGGDWAVDRLVPDVVRAIASGQNVVVRNPDATRPWQHVLDCLSGYLQLGARLWSAPGRYEEAWNFGPNVSEPLPVAELVTRMLAQWPDHATRLEIERGPPDKEAHALRVDSSKAIRRLGWKSCWSTSTALEATIAWYRDFAGNPARDMRAVSIGQIGAYSKAAHDRGLAWAAT